MSEPLTASVIGVLMPDKSSTAGGGLMLTDKRVAASVETVAHALGLAPDAAPPADSELLLEFPFVAPKKPVRAKLVFWPTAQADAAGATGQEKIAVLELLEPAPVEKKTEDSFNTNLPTDEHYDSVIDSLEEGELVPFFGAGVNMCGRPANTKWSLGHYLPSGGELADYLANKFNYPWPETHDLLRVSQYVALMRGVGPLNKRLREIFIAEYPPTPLHKFFARLPKVLEQKTGRASHQLIVTTNYDDVMEHAFGEAGEQFDVVTYMTTGSNEQRGKFLHCSSEGEVRLIEKPNEYRLPLDENRNLKRSVVLKIHGAVDRQVPDRDSYVITEDHYIDYLTRSDISSLVPITLAEKLKSSNFLFLGYSLRDWNLRVILHRIWMEQQQNANYKSWAIQLKPEKLEQKFWENRNVEIFHSQLDDYIVDINRRLDERPDA
jgi:hypothetical protein